MPARQVNPSMISVDRSHNNVPIVRTLYFGGGDSASPASNPSPTKVCAVLSTEYETNLGGSGILANRGQKNDEYSWPGRMNKEDGNIVNLKEELGSITAKLQKEIDDFDKKQKVQKSKIQEAEKDLEKISKAHKVQLGLIKEKIKQIQSKVFEKTAAGGSSEMTELVTQMVERNEGVKSELECPVCLDEMVPPGQIWMCQNGHSICGECRGKMASCCPSCKKSLAIRNIALEKVAMKLYL